jgi:hypothetical protein
MSDGYNGWTNYETWVANLWIGNDEGAYSYWMEQTKSLWNRCGTHPGRTQEEDLEIQLSDMLKSEVTEEMPEVGGMFGDMLTASVGRIDWSEIAKGIIEGISEDLDGYNKETEEVEDEKDDAMSFKEFVETNQQIEDIQNET